MKIRTVMIYFTICVYANSVFAHGLPEYEEMYLLLQDKVASLQIHREPREVPTLRFLNEVGETEEINAKYKKVLVVNFWATWCVPCREEMPSLQNLAESFNAKTLSVITIASGRQSMERITDFYLENQISSLPKYRDPKGKLAASFGVYGLPTTVIINQHFKEIGRLVGTTNWNSTEVKEILELIVSAHNK